MTDQNTPEPPENPPAPAAPAAEAADNSSPIDVAAVPKRPETTADLLQSQGSDYAIVEKAGSHYMVRRSQQLAENETGVALKEKHGEFYLNSKIREGEEPNNIFSQLIEMITLMINGQSVQGIKLDDAATQHVQQEVRAGRMSVLHAENTQAQSGLTIDTGGLHASRTHFYDQNGELIAGASVARPVTTVSAERAKKLDAMELPGLTVTDVADIPYAQDTAAMQRSREEPEAEKRRYVAVQDKSTGQIYYALVASGEETNNIDHSGAARDHQIVKVALGDKNLPLMAMKSEPKDVECLKVTVENGQTAYLELIPADQAAARALQLSEVTPLQLNKYESGQHTGNLQLTRERQKDKETGEFKFVPVIPDSFNAESLAMFEQGNAMGGKKEYGRALQTIVRPSFTESELERDKDGAGNFFAKTESGRKRAQEDENWKAQNPDEALVAEQRRLVLPEGTKLVTVDYRTGEVSASISDSSSNVYKWNLADVGEIDFSNVTYSTHVRFKGQTQGRELPKFSGLENLEYAKVSGLKTKYGESLSPGYNMPMLDGDVAGVMAGAFAKAADTNDRMAEKRQQREAEREMLAEMRHQNYHDRKVMSEKIKADATRYRAEHEGNRIGAAAVEARVARISQAFDGRPSGHFGQQGGGYDRQSQPFGAGGGGPQLFGQQTAGGTMPPEVVKMLQEQQDKIASLQSQIAAISGAPNQPGAGSPVSYEVALNSSPGNGEVRRT